MTYIVQLYRNNVPRRCLEFSRKPTENEIRYILDRFSADSHTLSERVCEDDKILHDARALALAKMKYHGLCV